MVTKTPNLGAIRGSKVVGAVLAYGDAGMSFDNGASLAIYNKFELTGLASVEATALVGRTVIEVNEGESKVVILLEGEVAIQVDMRDEAYTGPEAMQLRVPGEPIVVWN